MMFDLAADCIRCWKKRYRQTKVM